MHSRTLVRSASAVVLCIAALCAFDACSSTGDASHSLDGSQARGRAATVAAWERIYSVLQNPRCVNCHPAGDVPLQGDDRHPHAQNVQRGPDGQGYFAMRCDACHSTRNAEGRHLPPGAPNWHLPSAEVPMVFEGRTSTELCRQLVDRSRNGGRGPAQLLAHLSSDPLVLWGWNPGEGRAPVQLSREEFLKAVRTWVDGDCACP